MPPTKAKPLKSQRVREKSKIDDLFSRLMALYEPGPFPPSLPIFQGAEVPVLLFPTLQIAQARVWRNWEGTHSEELKTAVNEVCLQGLAQDQVYFLIGLCEALFRQLLVVELHLEQLFPGFLFSRSQTWPPSGVACDLLARDFRQRWNEEEETYGREWVLAAGAIPLRIKHRPALIAPWVVGATVSRWLTLKGSSDDEAINLTSRLIAVLLKREVRTEELRHWGSLISEVLVTTDDGKVPLPGYLVEPIARFKSPVWPEQMTPAHFLEAFPIDGAACEQFAVVLQQAWRRPKQRPSRPKRTGQEQEIEAASSPEQEAKLLSSPCLRCRALVRLESIYDHLESTHGIDCALVESLPNRRELRYLGTGEVLFRWE